MTIPDHPPAPAIVIAAGGDGQRMGGDKPLRALRGQSLLAHAIARAAAQSGCLAVAVRDAAQVGAIALPILPDAAPGLGPISALASAFAFAVAERRAQVLLIGCDQPFLPTDLAQRLSAALGDHQVAMPVRGGKVQPLAALWRVDQPALAGYIMGGGRSLWRFADLRGVIHVDWPITAAPDPFANINDPAALAEAERQIAASNGAQLPR